MRDRLSYGVLREAHRDAEAVRAVEQTGHVTPIVAAERAPDRQTALDRHETARDALTQRLDQQVQTGRIDRAELVYQLNRFENGSYRESQASAPERDAPATGDRPSFHASDRADMISQQRDAMERLRGQQQDRATTPPAADRAVEREPATKDDRGDARAALDTRLDGGEAPWRPERLPDLARQQALER